MKWKLFSIFIVLTFVLVACNTPNEEGMRDRNTDGNNVQPTRNNDDVNNNRNNVRDTRNGVSDQKLNNRRNGNMNNNRADRNNKNNRNNNDRYNISEDAANKITDEISDIDHAYVLTTKNNAYVAAQLDADDRDGNNATRNKSRSNRNDKANRDDDRKDRNRGNDTTRNDGTNDRNLRNNNRTDDGNQLTDDVKNEIADIVKSVDNDIDNVYVSTNPDFLDLTSNYANDMNNGHPVRGFFDKMGDMVERLFPQNK